MSIRQQLFDEHEWAQLNPAVRERIDTMINAGIRIAEIQQASGVGADNPRFNRFVAPRIQAAVKAPDVQRVKGDILKG